MTKKIYYKVLASDWTSARMQAPYSLNYKLGETTKALPGSTGILCFESLKDATRFATYDEIIVSCVGRGKRRKVTLIRWRDDNDWLTKIRKIPASVRLYEPPRGTIAFSEITPIERIK